MTFIQVLRAYRRRRHRAQALVTPRYGRYRPGWVPQLGPRWHSVDDQRVQLLLQHPKLDPELENQRVQLILPHPKKLDPERDSAEREPGHLVAAR